MIFYNCCRTECSKCNCIYTVTLLTTQFWHEHYIVKHLSCKPVEEMERGEWYESIL